MNLLRAGFILGVWGFFLACGGAKKDGSTCSAESTCPAGEVCDLTTMTCVAAVDAAAGGDASEAPDAAVACTTHDDCGGAAYCSSAGYCVASSTGAPCVTDNHCNGQTCVSGYCGCGGSFVNAARVPANLLIALDRSGSMVTNDVPGTNPVQNRWEVANAAVNAVLTSHGDEVRFGLDLWPGSNEACNQGGSCSPGAVFVDPAAATATAIAGVLGNASTCSYGTPITGALTALQGYAGLADATPGNYVLLITDGQQQSCTGDPVAAVTALRGQTPKVKTFVVGFSGDVDEAQLEAMAVAGGTARAGTPMYYQADDAAALAAAFDAIAASVISCNYQLETVPPDPSELYVYFDRVLVNRDQTQVMGWDYDPGTNQIIFYGVSCDQLQNGQVTDLAIVYGCPIIID